jgi:hypothetical protein
MSSIAAKASASIITGDGVVRVPLASGPAAEIWGLITSSPEA